MHFTKTRLLNFRNIRFSDIDFNNSLNFLLGANGQGKSNLLEALGFVTTLRSFRTNDYKPLFLKGENELKIFYEISHENLGLTEVEIQIKGNKKFLYLDGEKVNKMADFIGLFPVVALHSNDLMILKGAPQERRRYIDTTLSSTDSAYFNALKNYTKGISERNKLIKNNGKSSEFKAFEKDISHHAFYLSSKRKEEINYINNFFTEFYVSFMNNSRVPVIRYKSDCVFDNIAEYENFFEKNREKDRIIGSTYKGVHRDDYEIKIPLGNSKEYESDGEQRGICIALKMAQAKFYRKKLGIKPVILIDDILGELDNERKEVFWKNCIKDFQIIASGTSFIDDNSNWYVWNVLKGKFNLLIDR